MEPTIIYEEKQSTEKIVSSVIPTERSQHIAIPYFAICDWKSEGSIATAYIPGKLNCSDALTKPLGWVLHNRHVRQLMGHYNCITHSTDDHNLDSGDSRLGEGIGRTDTGDNPNPNSDMNPNSDLCHL